MCPKVGAAGIQKLARIQIKNANQNPSLLAGVPCYESYVKKQMCSLNRGSI